MKKKNTVAALIYSAEAALDAESYYESKLFVIRQAQEAGLSDRAIETLYNVTLRAEDRKN